MNYAKNNIQQTGYFLPIDKAQTHRNLILKWWHISFYSNIITKKNVLLFIGLKIYFYLNYF